MSNKATSAVAIATILLVAIAFGFWLVSPGQVDAASMEENATDTSVTVNQYVACGAPSSYANGIEFGTLDPETNDNPNTDGEYNFHSPSTNNVNIHYYIKANDALTRGGNPDKILLGNYTWDDNTTSGQTDVSRSQALTTDYVSFDDGTNVAPDSDVYLKFWLDIPITTPGDYNNTVTVKCNVTS